MAGSAPDLRLHWTNNIRSYAQYMKYVKHHHQSSQKMKVQNKDTAVKVLNSIQGKVMAMVAFFLLSFTVTTLWNSYQNNRLKAISEKTIDFRMPVTLNANSVLSGLNRVGAAQRAYIMTKDDAFRAERHMVWDSQIRPAFDDLLSKRDQLTSGENRARVDSLNLLLNRYYILQDNIDDYVDEHLDLDEHAHIEIDSTQFLSTMNSINLTREKRRILQRMVNERALALRNRMRDMLQPFSRTNNGYIKNEISSVNDKWGIIIALLSILVSVIIAVSVIYNLKRSIQKPIELLDILASGRITDHVEPTKDELSSIIRSGNLLASNMKKASDFALSVGKGDFGTSFETLGKNDILGNALVEMREQLKEASEKERNRMWLNDGMAQINQILREESEGKGWYLDIISYLLKFLDAVVGGIYLVEEKDGEEVVNLKACIAYDREKFNEVSVGKSEGLIGSCIFEGESIYLKELPGDYLNITSGLGHTAPKCLLLLPLKNNGSVIGVLELASLKLFSGHQLDFLDKISENIGVAFMRKENTERTKRLLEISKTKTEELQAVEEELRQNNEELMVTQEKLAGQERALSGKLEAIDRTVLTIEFDMDGRIVTANRKFMEEMGYDINELVGQHHRIFCEEGYARSDAYKRFWERLGKGKIFTGKVTRVDRSGEKIGLIATYYPIYGKDKGLTGVHKIAYLVNGPEQVTEEAGQIG